MHINDVGIIAATVQWRGRFEEMAPTAATLAVLFSVTVYGIIWFLAPSFAQLAGSPEATPVVRLLTVVILIDGVTAVRTAALQRRFQQDKLTQANVAGFVVQAPLAVGLAVLGAGPFSVAIGQVAGALVTGVLVFAFAKVPVMFGFDRAIARKLVRFGIPLAASLGIEAILVNADYVIVGRLMGVTALGFYLLAFNISTWALGVMITAVRYVSIPAFSRLAEQKGSLSIGVQRSVPLLISVVLPVAVLTALLAPALVVFLYGDKWAPAVPVLRFLMILTVVRVLTSFTFDILTSVGATRATLWLNLGWAVALIPALYVSTSMAGIRGAAMGHALVALLVALPLAILLLHRAGVQLAPIAPQLVRPLLGCGLAATVCLLVVQMVESSLFLQLAVAGSAGLITYVLIVVPWEQLRRWGRRDRALIPVLQSGCAVPTTAGRDLMEVTQTLVSIGLPVRNGEKHVENVVRSVLGQDHEYIELVISDNASTDGTEEICRELARSDRRIAYFRQPENIGLINNNIRTKQLAHGMFFRLIGDDDLLFPNYVSRCLEAFAEDERLILVTTQLAYTGPDGHTEFLGYHGTRLRSEDPVTRFAELLSLLNESHLLLDPLYGLFRRAAVVSIPIRNTLRGDEVLAAKLALAGPWGHVPEVLGHRHWQAERLPQLARKLGLPRGRPTSQTSYSAVSCWPTFGRRS